MRVIISGGSGLIGRALVNNLADGGYEVIVLSRSPGRVSGLPAGVRAVGWDVRSADGWGELADGALAIVNLAAENLAGQSFFPSRWTTERKQQIVQSRLEAGRAVVEAVEKAAQKPKVVIQASAIGYYGTSEDQTFTEDSPPGDDFPAQVCQQWEASTKPVAEMDVRHVIIRTGLVLSTKDSSLPRVMLPYRLFVGGPFGNGRQWWSWIHLNDQVRAIRFLIEQEAAAGPFNLTAPNPVQNRDFGRTLGKVMKRPHYLPVPAFAMRVAFGEVADIVLQGQRVIPERLQQMGFHFEYPQLEVALRDTIQQGI